MSLSAGNFNKRITFQSKGGIDAEGYPIEGKVDFKTLWAMVKTISAKEYHQAKSDQSEITTRFIIRYRTDLKEDMTILYGKRTFEIESIINDDEQNKTLTIIGKEVA